MSRVPELYPDLVQAGGLAPCLQVALIQIGSSLKVNSLAEIVDEEQKEVMSRFPTYARVEVGQRFSQVYIAAEKRLFLYDFWNRGVMLADASTPDIIMLATSIHRWIEDKVSTSQLREEFSFVNPTDSAQAFEAGEEVEWRWKQYEKSIPDRLPELRVFFRLASRTDELRHLFPFTSLNCFCFSRCTGYPYTDDCPYVIPITTKNCDQEASQRYEVRLGQKCLGEGTGEEAVKIVVQNLPEGCGPAVAGTADDID